MNSSHRHLALAAMSSSLFIIGSLRNLAGKAASKLYCQVEITTFIGALVRFNKVDARKVETRSSHETQKN